MLTDNDNGAINDADSNNNLIYDGNKDVEENGYANKGNQDNLTKASEGKSKHSATDQSADYPLTESNQGDDANGYSSVY